uniref:ATP synthase CF0 subunit I n=1 Tax=Flexiglena variabilis TaxID=2743688 RepID=UPI0023AADCEA|nr:ATP synthase CF0 subunit I [Flexiglena variabilis]WCH63487.1 ATP synthase CF0 subunit I [Flexiglena variabilis]
MVIILNINLFDFLSEREGFGINTDLLDTNILNLSVVVGVLVYYGKSILAEYAQNRKDSILRSLQEADNKFKEASDNLAFAKQQFEIAKEKSEQIRNQGFVIAGQTSKKLLDAVEEDIKRLKDSVLSAIRFEEEKSVSEVVQSLYISFNIYVCCFPFFF